MQHLGCDDAQNEMKTAHDDAENGVDEEFFSIRLLREPCDYGVAAFMYGK